MPSWEDIINRVTIPSNYYNVEAAGQEWGGIFTYLDQVHHGLTTLKTQSESWKGGAADAFRTHIESMAKNIQDLIDDHRKIKDGLALLAGNLKTAVDSIPVPGWMYDEIEEKQRAYHNSGEVYLYDSGSFEHNYLKYYTNFVTSIPLVGDAWKAVEGMINDREEEAQNAYATLTTQYGQNYSAIPEGTPSGANAFNPTSDFNPSGGTGPGGMGGGPKMPGGGGAPKFPDPGGTPPFSADPANFDPAGTTGTGYKAPPHTSLEGVGGGPGGGLGGLGSGVGGPGVGAGLAGGGGGGGLSGARLPPIGPSTGLPGMMGMGAGAMGGAGAGRGGAGRGSGRGGAGRAGMVGQGAPGGHGGDGDERTTWLQEDEDVWGTNSDLPPGVLGA